jgi:hypothetical protein
MRMVDVTTGHSTIRLFSRHLADTVYQGRNPSMRNIVEAHTTWKSYVSDDSHPTGLGAANVILPEVQRARSAQAPESSRSILVGTALLGLICYAGRKYRRRFVAAILLACIGVGAGEAAMVAPLGGPAGRDWELVRNLSDEFGGPAVNDAIWQRGWLSSDPDNVQIANGTLLLTIPKASGSYSPGAYMASREMGSYGYYEARMKPNANTGREVGCAFWLFNGASSNGINYREIDIVEQFGSTDPWANFNLYHRHDGGEMVQYWNGVQDSTFPTDYHVYGLDWTPTTLTTYIDGVKIVAVENPAFDIGMSVVMSYGYAKAPSADQLPASMSFDYVRVWQAVPEPSSIVLLIVAVMGLTPYAWRRQRAKA